MGKLWLLNFSFSTLPNKARWHKPTHCSGFILDWPTPGCIVAKCLNKISPVDHCTSICGDKPKLPAHMHYGFTRHMYASPLSISLADLRTHAWAATLHVAWNWHRTLIANNEKKNLHFGGLVTTQPFSSHTLYQWSVKQHKHNDGQNVSNITENERYTLNQLRVGAQCNFTIKQIKMLIE